MKERPLRTTVVGSYPLPGWLELASRNLDAFGPADLEELQTDAVIAAVHDQVAAGLDVITDGEPTRLDFNLSFYGHLEGIEREAAAPRRFGPPGHDQRGRHRVTGEIRARAGLGVVKEFERLRSVAPPGPSLKASVPGPYTLAGRLLPSELYPDRWALAEALLPVVQTELLALVAAGCREICVDEPVDVLNRTIAPVVGRCRLDTHLCFGNYNGRAVAPRRYAPLFPAFLSARVDEIHLEMASREMAELPRISEVAAAGKDVAVGIVDVKSYWIEPPEEVADRVRACLRHAPPERLAFAPDCGLSQTARWAARAKLRNLVEGVARVRMELGL